MADAIVIGQLLRGAVTLLAAAKEHQEAGRHLMASYSIEAAVRAANRVQDLMHDDVVQYGDCGPST